MIDIFWYIYLGVLAISPIGILVKGDYKKTFYKLDFVISIITWIGLFGYVTNNQILTPIVWKFVFIGGLIWHVLFGFKQFNEEASNDMPKSSRLVFFGISLILLTGPLYYGIFNYAFK